MDADSQVERRIFQRKFGDLSVGIRDEISVFVTELYSDGMISVDVRDRALNTSVDKGSRASALLSALESRIRTDSSAFRSIVKILESIPALSHLAQSLQADFQYANVKLESRPLPDDQLRSAQVQKLPPPRRLETREGTQQPFTSVTDQPDVEDSDRGDISSSVPASATTEGQSESVLPQLKKPPGKSLHLLLPQSSESEEQVLRKVCQGLAHVREVIVELENDVGAIKNTDGVSELKHQIEQLKLSHEIERSDFQGKVKDLQLSWSELNAEKRRLQEQLRNAEEDVKDLTSIVCRLNKTLTKKEQKLSVTEEELKENQEEREAMKTKVGELEKTIGELKVKLCGADKRRKSRSWPQSRSI